MSSTLSPLQRSILEALVDVDGWRLTGGGALAGYHLAHRTTADLDLFFGGRSQLGTEPDEVLQRIRAAGMDAHPVQTTPGFERHLVEQGPERVILDLVADPVPTLHDPERHPPGILVDSAQEILTNKVTALLSRAEVRDLVDVMALVEAGADLEQALMDAPRKDGGFSPMTLAWVLGQFPLRAAASLGFDAERLGAFRDRLVERLTRD